MEASPTMEVGVEGMAGGSDHGRDENDSRQRSRNHQYGTVAGNEVAAQQVPESAHGEDVVHARTLSSESAANSSGRAITALKRISRIQVAVARVRILPHAGEASHRGLCVNQSIPVVVRRTSAEGDPQSVAQHGDASMEQHFPVVEHEQPVDQRFHVPDLVSGDHENPVFFQGFGNEAPEEALGRDVQPVGRLVHHHQRCVG